MKRKMPEFLSVIFIFILKLLVFIYDVITYPFYYAIQQPSKTLDLSNRRKASIIYKSSKRLVLRNLEPLSSVQQEIKANASTMAEVYQFARTRNDGQKKFLGTREILRAETEQQPDGKKLQKFVMGEYKWLTYGQTYLMATNIGKGLKELGLDAGTKVIIFAETRAEWFLSLLGCFLQNITVVTLYANLGEEGILHGLLESEASHLITSFDLLPTVQSLIQKCQLITSVIFMESRVNPRNLPKAFPDYINLHPMKEVVELGKVSKLASTPPDRNDIAVIMYTSGSTGVPKGVQILHSNLVSALIAYVHVVGPLKNDQYVSFLPLAHSLELVAECWCLLNGVPIGYSTPLTLTDASSKIKKGTLGDLSVLKPTIFTAVPLIFDRIYKEVKYTLTKQSSFKRKLFHFCFNYRKYWLERGYDTPIMKRVIFSKMRRKLGGNVRVFAAGGAPLSPDTHEFLRILFCSPVVQAYGLTETLATGTSMPITDLHNGRVGVPFSSVDLQLINWEEGNYSVTDRPNPRGEVVLGGDMVALGYFKLGELTQQDFFEENGMKWFKTGDIGEIEPDGSLKIIDRKKDLVKLSLGEYVSLGKVESLLKTCPIIDNICVCGDPSQDFIVALVVPDIPKLMGIGNELNKNKSYRELCVDDDVVKYVTFMIKRHAIEVKLQKFEIPEVIKLVDDSWTPDSGLVTAAFKLKRKDIQNQYQSDIDRMYRHPGK